MPRFPRATLGRVAISAALFTITAVAAGCAANAGASEASVDRYPGGDQRLVGHVAGRTLQGGRVDLADWRGHVIVVDFWSSTCAPCVAEQRTLNAVARATRAAGVRFVGIDERDDASQARAYLAAHHVTYPSLFDPDGQMTLQFPGAAPQTTPTTIVVTAQGRIAARVNGSILYTQLMALVHDVMAGPA